MKVFALFTLLGIIPIVAYITFVIGYFPTRIENSHLIPLLIFTLYLTVIFLFTYVSWLDHELDILIVTNERIIYHDQVGFFHREVSETHLDQVQDIKGAERGIIQTIFHFGIMEIRTAADLVVFRIHDADNPFENARKVLDIRDKFMRKMESL